MPGYWFTSSLFNAEPGEDEETNPRLYGRQPANWLREKFISCGYPVAEVIPEDWGWCVMCQREPYALWVGCVNLRDYECAKEGDPPPTQEKLLWNAFPVAEIPFFRYLLRHKPDVAPGLAKLDFQLRAFLEAEPGIRLLDASVANSWLSEDKNGALQSTRTRLRRAGYLDR